MSTPRRPTAQYTIGLVRDEVPLAVVVVYADHAVQMTVQQDASPARVADAMVAAAFEVASGAELTVPRPRRDEVYDVDTDGGLG